MPSDNHESWLEKLALEARELFGLGEDYHLPAARSGTTAPLVIVTRANGLSVKDAAGHVWTLTAAGMCTESGKAVAGGGGTSELTSVSGLIWAQGSVNLLWYTFVNGNWISQGNATPSVPALPTAPSQVLNVRTTAVKPTSISLAWNAPKTGSLPISYTVFIRKRGAAGWNIGATSSVTAATVLGVAPSTEYDLEIQAHN
jgi:hypothetical protein